MAKSYDITIGYGTKRSISRDIQQQKALAKKILFKYFKLKDVPDAGVIGVLSHETSL